MDTALGRAEALRRCILRSAGSGGATYWPPQRKWSLERPVATAVAAASALSRLAPSRALATADQRISPRPAACALVTADQWTLPCSCPATCALATADQWAPPRPAAPLVLCCAACALVAAEQ